MDVAPRRGKGVPFYREKYKETDDGNAFQRWGSGAPGIRQSADHGRTMGKAEVVGFRSGRGQGGTGEGKKKKNGS